MKRKVASFNEFAFACPYFTSEYRVNNWYGCNHPTQEETDPDENGIERGKCYCWSCPLGVEPDEEDWNKSDGSIDWDGFDLGDFTGIDGEWLMYGEHISVSIEPDASDDEKQALYNYERHLNRYNKDWDGGTWKHLHKT